MKLLLILMVCEPDKVIADLMLEQLVDLCADVELHILIFDDASESLVGEQLKQKYSEQIQGDVEVLRCASNRGYYRLQRNLFDMLQHAVTTGVSYDYVLKVDPDVHFTDRRIAMLLDVHKLPDRGSIGHIFKVRKRELVQIFGDLLPFGFRRRKIKEKIDHQWQWRFYRKVWWSDIGRKAIFRRNIRWVAPGSFYLVAWDSVLEIASRGYLDRDHERIGLVFGEDLLLSILITAIGHPMTAFTDIDPDFKCALFLDESSSSAEVRAQRLYYIHPVKDTPAGIQLRRDLPLD